MSLLSTLFKTTPNCPPAAYFAEYSSILLASWIEDYSISPANDIEWEKIDFKILAQLLYMGKIYE